MIVCEKEVTNLNYVWHSHLMSSSCPISCTAGKIGFLVNSSPSMQLNKKKFPVKQNFARIPLTVFLIWQASSRSKCWDYFKKLERKKGGLNLAHQDCRDSSVLWLLRIISHQNDNTFCKKAKGLSPHTPDIYARSIALLSQQKFRRSVPKCDHLVRVWSPITSTIYRQTYIKNTVSTFVSLKKEVRPSQY